MADLQFIVGYDSVKAANKELLKIGTNAQKSASVFERAFKKAESQSAKALRQVKNQMKVRQRLAKQRNAEADAASKVTALAVKEEDRLKNKYDQSYRAMVIYTKELNDLSMARSKDIITTDQQAKEVAALNAQMAAGTGAFANAGKAMTQVNNKMNGSNMAVQQLGYQFGDFAVQVQGGTSAFVAFSQQGAQLAGMLPMIAGPLGLTMGAAVGLSAALGIGIPIFSAVGRLLFEMGDSAKEAKTEAKGLEERLNSLTEALREYGRVQEAVKLGVSVEEFDASKGIANAEKELKDAEETVARIQNLLSNGAGALGVLQFREQVLSLFDKDAASRYEAAVSSVTAAEKRLADLRVKESDEQKILHDEEMSSRNSVVAAIQKEGRVQLSMFGLTKAQQEESNNLREFQNTLIEAGLTPMDHQYLKALQYYNQMLQNKAATDGQAKALEDAAKAQLLLSAAGEGYEAQLQIVNAQITALQEGKNAEVAAFLEGERVKVTAIYETSKALHLQTGNVIALAQASLTFLDAMDSLDSLSAAKAKLAALKAPPSIGGGGGSSSTSSDPVEKLRQQIELNSKLVGLSKGEATVLTQVHAIQNSLGKDRGKYSRETIVGLIEQNEAYKEQQRVIEETKAKQDALATSIASSFGDAFTSIIDGTKSAKDAFKDMARSIIKQLLDVLVIQGLVGQVGTATNPAGSGIAGMISGAFGGASANGNVFSGGSQVQAYANGGVVNRPTNFPMSGNKMGLMGEAGPEAIMPLKRGANGKLGVQAEGSGGGDVINIHQSFNFQANGDETVKKLIAQAAPKIAQMTKSSLIDDRRRGGVTKSAFG